MKKLFLLGLFSFFLFVGCNIINDDNDGDDKDYSYVGTWTASSTEKDGDGTKYHSYKLILTKTTFVNESNYRRVENDGSVTDEDSDKSLGTIQNLGDYTLRQILLKQEMDGTMYDVSNESAFRSAYEKDHGEPRTDSEWVPIYKSYTSPNDVKYSISGNKMTVSGHDNTPFVYTKQ
ncbi:hypothetical protein [Spirochaeta cellobiosiphila]|uniref:hypothetical protein n=1 Tax=Spirochaeta cellobiosiphila TaxID=504483 RepID=UPI0003F8DB55|nr:hypothetical protein [Spirochaeta cellobiosiphila]